MKMIVLLFAFVLLNTVLSAEDVSFTFDYPDNYQFDRKLKLEYTYIGERPETNILETSSRYSFRKTDNGYEMTVKLLSYKQTVNGEPRGTVYESLIPYWVLKFDLNKMGQTARLLNGQELTQSLKTNISESLLTAIQNQIDLDQEIQNLAAQWNRYIENFSGKKLTAGTAFTNEEKLDILKTDNYSMTRIVSLDGMKKIDGRDLFIISSKYLKEKLSKPANISNMSWMSKWWYGNGYSGSGNTEYRIDPKTMLVDFENQDISLTNVDMTSAKEKDTLINQKTVIIYIPVISNN
jgi:hypothetical protein